MSFVSAAAVALLVASLLSSPAAAETRVAEVPAGITKLLRDYGTAFEEHDRSRLTATLTGGLARTEPKALTNATGVPFSDFDVTVITRFSGNLASARIRKAYDGFDVATYHVVMETTLDVEDEPYTEDGAFTFVRTAHDATDRYDGWRLAAKGDLDVLGFFSPHFLWDEDAVAVQRSRHFLLLTHPQIADEMRPVLEAAERALERANAFWPRPSSERYAIIVPSTTAELGRIAHTTVDLRKFVAYVAAGVDRSEEWSPAQPRLFVHLDHLRNYHPDAQLEILTHELIHTVTRSVSGPHMPSWIEEGIANTGGGSGGRASRAREGPAPDDFPRDEEFVTGSVSEIQRRYDQGQVGVQVLIDQKGKEGMARFYETLGRARTAPGTDRYLLERAIEESLDWTIDDWLAEWRKTLG